MQEKIKEGIWDIKFIDFEDLLGIGLQSGYKQIVVPQSGFENYDTFEGTNPFQTVKQR